jgi:hypothetical protein
MESQASLKIQRKWQYGVAWPGRIGQALASTMLPLLLLVGSGLLGGLEGAASNADLEGQLFAAVFRQQKVELLDQEARAQGIVLCLAIDPGGAPQSLTAEALKALSLGPSVRRGAECEVRRSRAVEIASKRTAIVVTVGPIDWVKADEAWVTVTQTWSVSKSFRHPYRVVLEPDGTWSSLGPILKDGPA